MYVTFNNMGNTGVDVKTNVCNLTDAFALAIVFFTYALYFSTV